MFRLTLIDGNGTKDATVAISGAAVFTDAREMQQALGRALDGCEHLIIDLGQVEQFDLTFRATICALHRHSELVHKKITLQGALAGRGDPLCLSTFRECLRRPDQCCHLWGALPAEPGAAAGRLAD
jgi:hypothetical protein